MTHTLCPAHFEITAEGTPYSPEFDDVYHSRAGALAQAKAVFLEGNQLPKRWQGQDRFIIVETGFGLGGNFLATWQAWRDDPQRCERLHFVSVEKYPVQQADLQDLYHASSEQSELTAALVSQWPTLTSGLHRLHFDQGRVTLTLVWGDAREWLPKLATQADAFYLDGFSPAKNPELWCDTIYQSLARLAAPNATLATYTVAGHVRRGLIAAGFAVEKQSGFADKRHRLAGQFTRRVPDRRHAPMQRQALVIGAGLAGCLTAERLAARGWQVSLLDRHTDIAQEASGNHAGVLLPVLSLDDNLQSRMARAGYLYANRQLQQWTAEGHALRWSACGVLQLGRDAEHAAQQARIVEALRVPAEYCSWLDAEQVAAKTGRAAETGGWWFPSGSWIHPPDYCRAALARYTDRIQFMGGQAVASVRYHEGEWLALNHQGDTLAHAPTLIVANATAATELLPELALPLSRGRRIVSLLPTSQAPSLDFVLCRNAYLTPHHHGFSALGASAAPEGSEPNVEWHQANLDKLHSMLPQADQGIDPSMLTGRGCDRPTTPDRLPLIGALPRSLTSIKQGMTSDRIPRAAGLYAALGFGARGLAWAALAGEVLACQLNGEPLPVERDLLAACDPARFAVRQGGGDRSAVSHRGRVA